MGSELRSRGLKEPGPLNVAERDGENLGHGSPRPQPRPQPCPRDAELTKVPPFASDSKHFPSAEADKCPRA